MNDESKNITTQGICWSCQAGCEESCENGCEYCDICEFCEFGCEVDCQGSSDVPCQIGCEVKCETYCESNCQASCETSCELACETSCQYYCENGCEYCDICEFCEYGCEVDCQGSSDVPCQIGCEVNCETYCESHCQDCESSCDSCESCDTYCDVCDSCDTSCNNCDSCDTYCDTCDSCDTSCNNCDSCDTYCDVCDSCDTSCDSCDSCDTYCDACDSCDSSCDSCDSSCEYCVACQSCESSCNHSYQEPPPPLSNIILSVQKEAYIGDEVLIQASCINAHHISIKIVGPIGSSEELVDWIDGMGESMSETYRFLKTGAYEITAYARNTASDKDPGTEQRVSETHRIVIQVDLRAPTWPSGAQLIATNVTSNSVTLSWPEATDNIGVEYYYIYRDDFEKEMDTVPSSQTTYTDRGTSEDPLVVGQTYTYEVRAADIGDEDPNLSEPLRCEVTIPAGIVKGWNLYGLQVPDEPILNGTGDKDIVITNIINEINNLVEFGTSKIAPAAYRYVEAAIECGVLPADVDKEEEYRKTVELLKWNQHKIHRVWERAKELNVDPCIMIGVLRQEGTGSFDTNKVVKMGGDGIQPDFEKDLEDALNSNLFRKMATYPYYAAAFREKVEEAGLGGGGNIFQWWNYYIPWYPDYNKPPMISAYATHNGWWIGASSNYERLAGAGATQIYSDIIINHPLPIPVTPPPVYFTIENIGTDSENNPNDTPMIVAHFM